MGDFWGNQAFLGEQDRRFRTQATPAGGSSVPPGGPAPSGGLRLPGTADSPVPPSTQAPESVRSSALTESVRRDQPPFPQVPPGRRGQESLQALESERRRWASCCPPVGPHS